MLTRVLVRKGVRVKIQYCIFTLTPFFRELDGGPQREIEPGGSWSLDLPVRQQASSSWYHPHTHHKTGPQTYNGLADMFIIDDENSDDLPLPKTYGIDDNRTEFLQHRSSKCYHNDYERKINPSF